MAAPRSRDARLEARRSSSGWVSTSSATRCAGTRSPPKADRPSRPRRPGICSGGARTRFSRAAPARDRGRGDASGDTELGERRPIVQLGTHRPAVVRQLRVRGSAALSLDHGLDDLERAEPAALAAAHFGSGLRHEAPQPGVRADPRREPARRRRRWDDSSTVDRRRRLARLLDSRDGAEQGAARRVRASPVPLPAAGASRRGPEPARTARPSRWPSSSAC